MAAFIYATHIHHSPCSVRPTHKCTVRKRKSPAMLSTQHCQSVSPHCQSAQHRKMHVLPVFARIATILRLHTMLRPPSRRQQYHQYQSKTFDLDADTKHRSKTHNCLTHRLLHWSHVPTPCTAYETRHQWGYEDVGKEIEDSMYASSACSVYIVRKNTEACAKSHIPCPTSWPSSHI